MLTVSSLVSVGKMNKNFKFDEKLQQNVTRLLEMVIQSITPCAPGLEVVSNLTARDDDGKWS